MGVKLGRRRALHEMPVVIAAVHPVMALAEVARVVRPAVRTSVPPPVNMIGARASIAATAEGAAATAEGAAPTTEYLVELSSAAAGKRCGPALHEADGALAATHTSGTAAEIANFVGLAEIYPGILLFERR